MVDSNKERERIKKRVISGYKVFMLLSGKKPNLKQFKERLSNPEVMDAIVEHFKKNGFETGGFTHDITKRTYKAKKNGKDS